MRRIIVVGLVLTALMATLAGAASAGEILQGILQRGEVRVGTAPENPPLSLRSRDNKLMGYDIDLAALLAEAMGVKLRLVPLPFPELLPALEQGKLDLIISGMTMSAQRNTRCLFVGPYLVSGQSLLARAETAQRLNQPSDFNQPGVIIAAAKDTTSLAAVKELMPQAHILEVDNQEQGLKAVLENKAHVLVAEHAFCVLAVLRFGDEQGLSLLDKPFTFEPLGIALGEDAHLVNWLENFLLTLRGTGRQELLNQRWFKDAGWLKEMEPNRLL
ncbi:MAG: transporter substrate-binding domain-containing protein [Desulfarculus sp.]|nr:transporter substrate-binding domain-containing protein [Desulfarculus sp.]